MSAPRKLRKRARARLSPRTTRRIAARWNRQRVKDQARRILESHYPDPKQECPF